MSSQSLIQAIKSIRQRSFSGPGWSSAAMVDYAELMEIIRQHEQLTKSPETVSKDAVSNGGDTKPTEAMCDAARAFIMGLDMNIRNFGDMRKHLQRGGNPVLPYIEQMANHGQGSHITKWDVADCIYQYMMTAATPVREAGKDDYVEGILNLLKAEADSPSLTSDGFRIYVYQMCGSALSKMNSIEGGK